MHSLLKTCSALSRLSRPLPSSMAVANQLSHRWFSSFKSIEKGPTNTLEYRVFIEPTADAAKSLVNGSVSNFSPWHHIPLYQTSSPYELSYVNEIPIHTTAKFECATKELANPIKQDEKKGALRFFKYGKIPFNYGFLPQTWENNLENDPFTAYLGDNDPVDIVEISAQPLKLGEVSKVKVLGAFALIDEGETDWKVLAINDKDPLYSKINTVADIVTVKGQPYLDSIIHWFRYYKTADGKPVNSFAFNAEIKDEKFALKVIEHCHHEWRMLISNKVSIFKDSKLNVPSTADFYNIKTKQ